MSLKRDLAALDRALASSPSTPNPRGGRWRAPLMKPETIARRAQERAREREGRHADLVRRLRARLDEDPSFAEMIGEDILPEVLAAGNNPGKRRHWPRSSEVQTLLFPRDCFTVPTAWAWAKRHGFRQAKPDVTSDYIRLRQRDPAEFAAMRTIEFGESGIKAVVGARSSP